MQSGTQFEYQNWLGTERLRTDYKGAALIDLFSLPWGDGHTPSGDNGDQHDFAGMDRDLEDNSEHAQYRQYSTNLGRWQSPDPYFGSYDFTNPQSLNRYAYVVNNPSTLFDPSGLDGSSSGIGGCIGAAETGGTNVSADVECGVGIGIGIFDLLSALFDHPKFHGSLKPRPTAQPWNEYNIPYATNIAGALGLPDESCDFGACGGGPMAATGNVGVSVNYTLPFGISGTLFAGFVFDNHGHFGTYAGGGGGVAVGAATSGGVQVGISNGYSICAFGGPFVNYSGTLGVEAAGTGDYFEGSGDAPGGRVRGGGVTVGVGGGGSASAATTVTHISPFAGHQCVNGILQ